VWQVSVAMDLLRSTETRRAVSNLCARLNTSYSAPVVTGLRICATIASRLIGIAY
jgi:hypothetical protein